VVRAARFSADVLSSIAVLRADRVVPAAVVVMASARRVVLRERQAHGVRCIRHAPRRVGLQEHVLASASVPAWERVPASVLAPVWAADPVDWFRLRARLHVRSVRARMPGVGVSSTPRPRKAR
jgi:hypothetical protein